MPACDIMCVSLGWKAWPGGRSCRCWPYRDDSDSRAATRDRGQAVRAWAITGQRQAESTVCDSDSKSDHDAQTNSLAASVRLALQAAAQPLPA